MGSRIVKDRTFFFVAFGEDRRNAQASNSLRALSANGRATLQRLFPKGTNPRADLYDQVTTGLNAQANFFNVPLGAGRQIWSSDRQSPAMGATWASGST